MNIKNPTYNNDGTINCEFEHPVYGWIPFTASPNDCEELGRTIFARITKGDFGAIAPYIPPPYIRSVPKEVSRFQARAALLQAGLMEEIEGYMRLDTTDSFVKLAWSDAQVFKRASPLVSTIGSLFGLSEAQIDDLFIFAATIQA